MFHRSMIFFRHIIVKPVRRPRKAKGLQRRRWAERRKDERNLVPLTCRVFRGDDEAYSHLGCGWIGLGLAAQFPGWAECMMTLGGEWCCQINSCEVWDLGGWRNFLLHLQWLSLPVFLCELVFFFSGTGLGLFGTLITSFRTFIRVYFLHQTLVFLIW